MLYGRVLQGSSGFEGSILSISKESVGLGFWKG